jgi:hypothetical protein
LHEAFTEQPVLSFAVKRPKIRVIRGLMFVGMWQDRDDILDGINYVSSLRDNPRA